MYWLILLCCGVVSTLAMEDGKDENLIAHYPHPLQDSFKMPLPIDRTQSLTNKSNTFWENAPQDVMLHVFSFLNLYEAAQDVVRVNKKFHMLLNGLSYWRLIAQHHLASWTFIVPYQEAIEAMQGSLKPLVLAQQRFQLGHESLAIAFKDIYTLQQVTNFLLTKSLATPAVLDIFEEYLYQCIHLLTRLSCQADQQKFLLHYATTLEQVFQRSFITYSAEQSVDLYKINLLIYYNACIEKQSTIITPLLKSNPLSFWLGFKKKLLPLPASYWQEQLRAALAVPAMRRNIAQQVALEPYLRWGTLKNYYYVPLLKDWKPLLKCLARDYHHASAQFVLGHYYKGHPHLNDYQHKSFFWFKQAALQNHPVAQYHIGNFYLQDSGTWVNKSQLWYWLYKSAVHGKDVAQYHVGLVYAQSNRFNLVKAHYWLEKSARQGFFLAQCEIGRWYLEGRMIPQDDKQGIYWLQQAVQQNCQAAQYLLGRYTLEHPYKKPRYKQQGVYWLEQAADQGYIKAQCFLGKSYLEGQFITENLVKAIYWFKKAADQDDVTGQWYLQNCYLKINHLKNGYT